MKIIEYPCENIQIIWKPEICTHSGICVKLLPQVYQPKERPWIKPYNATESEIINQINQCPSGALSYIENKNKIDMIKIEHTDHPKQGVFKVYYDNVEAGEMTYTWANSNKFIIDHTLVNEDFNGKGLGKELVLAAVEYARTHEKKIIPLCPFAKATFLRNKDLQDVLFN